MRPAIDGCDVPIIGDIGCSPIWDGPGGWFESAAVAAAQGIFGFSMSLLSWIWDLIRDVTQPQTDGPFLYEWASRVFAISLPIIVAFLVFQIVMNVLRTRSAEGMGKAVAMAAVAVLGTSASVPIVHLLTSATDSLADDLTEVTFGDLNQLGDRLTSMVSASVGASGEVLSPDQMAVLGAGSAVAGAIGFIIFAAFLVIGSIAVFGALLIRTMLLYVTVVMGPLAIMGLAWEKTRSWFKIWAGVTVTLIVSKLAIMIVFGLGVTVLETLSFEQDGAGIAGSLLTGTLILLVAALMPVACFKFFNFVGDEIQADAMHGDTKAGVDRAGDVAQRYGPGQIMNAMRAGRGDDESGGSGQNGSGGGRSRPASTQSGQKPGDHKPAGHGPGSNGSPGSSGGSGSNGSKSGAGATSGGTGSGGGSAATGGTSASAPAASGAGGGGAAGGAAGGGAAGGAAAGVAAVVGTAVKAGKHAAQSASDQQSETTQKGAGRTGPDLTRPS